jgi:thymidylate kinase
LRKLRKIMEGIKEPDIVVYLRAEESVSERKDFGAERYETIEIQRQIQKNFDEIFSVESFSKIIKINSRKSIEEISKEINENIKELL